MNASNIQQPLTDLGIWGPSICQIITEYAVDPDPITVMFRDKVNPQTDPNWAKATFQSLGASRVIIWFIQNRGLRQDWLEFLTTRLLGPIRSLQPDTRFTLTNLQNWDLMKESGFDVTQALESRVVTYIQGFNDRTLCCLNSAEFFRYLSTPRSSAVCRYLNNTIWKRPEIWEKSSTRPDESRTVGEVFGEQNPNIASIRTKNISKSYSALQYLEGIFLINQVGLRNIVFLLPNDELDFYCQRSPELLAEDANALIRLENPEAELTAQVQFLPFKWAEADNQRPYLSNGVRIEKGKLKQLDGMKQLALRG